MTAIDWDTHVDVECPDGIECPHRIVCDLCNVALCAEHSNEFTTCAGNEYDLHHLDCAHDCATCRAGAVLDAAEQRAVDAWKGI